MAQITAAGNTFDYNDYNETRQALRDEFELDLLAANALVKGRGAFTSGLPLI